MMHAVDRSGSRSTGRSSALQAMKKGPRPRESRLKWSCRAFFTATDAVQMMTAILANSEGCNVTPTFSHLRAPLTLGAMASVPGSTVTIRSVTQPQNSGHAKRSHSL